MERSERSRREPIPKKILHCCCGRPECLILKRNFSVLESVEKDVHTAAQLGQALLSRHEAYMAEAERERMQLNARIDRLEIDKEELETQNSLKVQDNLALIDQLELLNNTVSDADAKIRTLEATLLSSQQALRHLEGTASRTADAERHLKELTEEQERLHEELQTSKEEARSHAYRFKEAQRGILDMQDQLDRMEREARQERERHAEIVEKMERQREVEKQLDAAAMRLKGAAASKSIRHHQRQGSNKIVGNFVRDLLQDNANLQLAISELREMLLNSNDEIQSLREQLLFHQPLSQSEGVGLSSSLRTELEPLMDSPKISQQMHVHHHYHISKQDGRRPKRKRQGLLGAYPPTSPLRPSSTPASSERWRCVSSPAGSSSRSCHDVTTPSMQMCSGTWDEYSVPSSALSSVVGSPESTSRGYFDHLGTDVDPPISPLTNYDPLSPLWRATHKKKISEASTMSFQSLSVIDSEYTVAHAHPPSHRWASTTIREEEEEEGVEEVEEDQEDQYSRALVSLHRTAPTSNRYLADELQHCQSEGDEADESEAGEEGVRSPNLPRIFTHEAMLSLTGGFDMNNLISSPGQITLRSLGGADAVVTGVNAEPTLSRTCSRMSDTALRNHFAHFQVSRLSSSLTPEAITSQTPRGGPGLGGWAGWRPWGGNSKPAVKPVNNDGDDAKRASGINQPGAVPGFSRYWMSQKRKGAPAQVTTRTIDRDALSDSLCGNSVVE